MSQAKVDKYKNEKANRKIYVMYQKYNLLLTVCR